MNDSTKIDLVHGLFSHVTKISKMSVPGWAPDNRKLSPVLTEGRANRHFLFFPFAFIEFKHESTDQLKAWCVSVVSWVFSELHLSTQYSKKHIINVGLWKSLHT